MTLDDLKHAGIVTAYIEDSELGRRFIACIGTMESGRIKSSDGQYWMAETELEAARQCYDDSGFGRAPDSAD